MCKVKDGVPSLTHIIFTKRINVQNIWVEYKIRVISAVVILCGFDVKGLKPQEFPKPHML